MKKIALLALSGLLGFSLCGSCKKETLQYGNGDLNVTVRPGRNWLHDFPLFLGIKRKNAPQIAIWIEDVSGKYLSTVYVTDKIATQSWLAAGGNRRKEALPAWCHARGVRYEDGLYLPTKKRPLTDGISGATPRGGFDVKVSPKGSLRQFVVKIEVNHSTDFNDDYPKEAEEGTPGWSGGKMGSGQPALVYQAHVDLDSGQETFNAALIGHSSPDGTNGTIDPDLSTLTSALEIVSRVTITVQP